jgi:hypothetical protein
MYDAICAEGLVKIPPSWDIEDHVIKLDLLRDWIFELQRLYNEALEKKDG